MDIRTAPLKTDVEEGDAYVDILVSGEHSGAPGSFAKNSLNVDVIRPKQSALAVRALFGDEPREVKLYTRRQKLRWVNPDGTPK
jgi:hypothetical protein